MISGNPTVISLTPKMILQEVAEIGVVDFDQIDEESLNNQIKYI